VESVLIIIGGLSLMSVVGLRQDFGNGILLGYLMWRSRQLPRPMVMTGCRSR
jgi:hypothetical protein